MCLEAQDSKKNYCDDVMILSRPFLVPFLVPAFCFHRYPLRAGKITMTCMAVVAVVGTPDVLLPGGYI